MTGRSDIGTSSDFSFARFADFLAIHNIEDWPRTRKQRLSDKEETWDAMKEMYEVVRPLAALKKTLGQTRMGIALEVDDKGFAHANLWPFAATSGRNQPSSKLFAFALAAWMRHLIKPPEGYGLAYLDWSAQEFHIAAYLSDDPAMKAVLDTADPYLAFAEMAESIPPGTLQRYVC